MATVNVEVGQVILGDRVEDSLAENNLQGEINNYNEEIEDNQEKVGAIAEEMSDQCETVDMATLEGWDKVGHLSEAEKIFRINTNSKAIQRYFCEDGGLLARKLETRNKGLMAWNKRDTAAKRLSVGSMGNLDERIRREWDLLKQLWTGGTGLLICHATNLNCREFLLLLREPLLERGDLLSLGRVHFFSHGRGKDFSEEEEVAVSGTVNEKLGKNARNRSLIDEHGRSRSISWKKEMKKDYKKLKEGWKSDLIC